MLVNLLDEPETILVESYEWCNGFEECECVEPINTQHLYTCEAIDGFIDDKLSVVDKVVV